MKLNIRLLETKKGHWYEIVDDQLNESIFLPSATNILECFPNKGLDIWRETSTPEEIRQAKEVGKIQGSKVHKCIELQIAGDTVSINGLTEEQISKLGLVDKKLISYLKEELTEREEDALIGFENFVEDYKPVFVRSEMMVYSKKYGYAGTMDCLCYLWDKKKKKYDLWIVDWKISKTVDRSYDLQIASYLQAFGETYRKGTKHIRIGVLQLGKNKCKYSFKEVKDKKEAWGLFLTTKKLWDDMNPQKTPPTTNRRQSFAMKVEYKKKGKIIKL